MSLHVLAYTAKRMIALIGVRELLPGTPPEDDVLGSCHLRSSDPEPLRRALAHP